MTLSKKIYELMEEHKITSYYKLASKLEITPPTLYKILKDKAKPSYDNLIKIADYFNVSIDYLVGRTDEREINKKVNK